MRNILILLVLISMGLTSAALADGSRGERGERGERTREEVRVEYDSSHYARHDRGQKYQHWQKRMHQLRKEARHERRADRRRDRHLRRHEVRHERHHSRRMVPVVRYRQAYAPRIFSSLVIRIPLNW